MTSNVDMFPRERRIRSIEKYISRFGEDDVCEHCKHAFVNHLCDKCGNGVCAKESCGLTFPERYNTTYVLCMGCIDKINEDLYLLIDMGKIEPLKNKIKNEKTKKQQWIRLNSTPEEEHP